MCEMEMHSGMSVALYMASTLVSMSWMGLSLPSSWLCHNSQSIIYLAWVCKKFGPCIDGFLTKYVVCIVITLPHLFEYHYQQFVAGYDMHFPGKTIVMKLFEPMQNA